MKNQIVEFTEKEIENFVAVGDFVGTINLAFEYGENMLVFVADLIYRTGYADGTLYRE